MKLTPEQERELVPELADWNHGDGISLKAWISCMGTYESAIGYLQLFWPEFAEHDECVLFAGFTLSSYEDFMSETDGDKRAVEAVMNHRHLSRIFMNTDDAPTVEQLLYFGRALKELWACKLARDFPRRTFVITLPEGPFEDVIDYQITFFQVREELAEPWLAADADAGGVLVRPIQAAEA